MHGLPSFVPVHACRLADICVSVDQFKGARLCPTFESISSRVHRAALMAPVYLLVAVAALVLATTRAVSTSSAIFITSIAGAPSRRRLSTASV